MTNYVEQLMELLDVHTCAGTYCGYCNIDNSVRCVQKDSTKCSLFYPDFTAEKQLALLKEIVILAERNHEQLHIEKEDEIWIMYVIGYDSVYEGSYSAHNKDFAQALAQLINELMNAGELDKSKVKEILEQ